MLYCQHPRPPSVQRDLATMHQRKGQLEGEVATLRTDKAALGIRIGIGDVDVG
jgi:hypothetical protein